MACTLEAPCLGVLVEDLAFAQADGGARRQFRCFNGHVHLIARPGPRPRAGRPMRVQCRARDCGIVFERVPISRRAKRLPEYCSQRCQSREIGRRRAKLSPAQVAKYYLDRNWSMVRIARHFGVSNHAAVQTALRRAGVEPRKHTATLACREPGCRQRVDLTVDRTKHGSTRCRAHRLARIRAYKQASLARKGAA